MSKGSAIVAILLAFAGGVAIGHLTGKPSVAGIEDDSGDDVAAAPDDGKERFRVPVSDEQPLKGADDALVTIVEFSDFQCPFCSRVNPTMARLMKEYDGKLRVTWRNQPLPFHKQAMPAHTLAMEAFEQGGSEKFWKAHDLLFKNQRALNRPDLEKYAQELGLDMAKVRAALDSQAHKAVIEADQALARQLGANGTPHFFINGRKLAGAQPYEKFKAVVDEEVKRGEELVKGGVSKANLYAAIVKNGLTKVPEKAAAPEQARRQPDPKAIYKVPVTDEPQKGPSTALVTIVEVSDFECPFCSRVEPTIDQVQKDYGSDVRVVWMNNPLPFHRNALPAHMAAMEAYKQGGNDKFWAMHKKLFANQKALSRADLERYAKELRLNMAQFKRALDTEAYKDLITKQQAMARKLGATGTPSFFINGRNLRGAQPISAFKSVIDEELARAKKVAASGTPRSKLYAELIKNGATEPKFVGGGAAPEAAAGPDPDKVYKIAVPNNVPRKGPRNAKVVIQEFSDFQCPFCSRVMPTLKQVVEEYGDRVQIVWRNYPLPFHKEAQPAAEASLEVYRQKGDDKFWAYHDLLFQNQRALSRADLERYAKQVGGINMAQFKQALDTGRHSASVKADMKAVQDAGARIGTPSFFINGRLLQGAQPFPAFKGAIERALKE